jgi:hypothetical protein
MNVLKSVISSVSIAMMIGMGCAVTEGPRPPDQSWKQPRSDGVALLDCASSYPAYQPIWDPTTNYYLIAKRFRECLKTKYGWYELGPPEYSAGTMAPPRWAKFGPLTSGEITFKVSPYATKPNTSK